MRAIDSDGPAHIDLDNFEEEIKEDTEISNH
jgi:hypothetical protein